MFCLHHSDVDNLTSSPAPSLMLSSGQSSREQSLEPSQEFPSKKRKHNKGNEQIDSLLVRNLKALEEPFQEDEEELFGRQVAMSLR